MTMTKTFKKLLSLSLVLTLIASSGALVSFAAEREKEYVDYGSYVLLGDSVASGWSDVEDRETRFVRVEGSYGAFVADDLGVDVYHPMACIGFRTTDLRYIFEDDYEPDRFLFYSISDEEMEWRIPLIREAVSEAGLITLNVGGNDWGSFVGWHIYEEMDKFEEKNEEFMTKARELLENAGTDADTVDSLIDLAALCGSLPELVKVLPMALVKGFQNFFENWNYVVEDIYALNPDVELIVIGMFDNSVQDQETADKNEAALVKLSVAQAIVDFANTPMRDSAEKYGYTFIDPVGTVCEQNHPSVEGHRHIANLILEALPDASFPYTDVDRSSAEYKAIEYMYLNGLMSGVSATEFAPDAQLTKAQLAEALGAESTDDSAASRIDVALAVARAAGADGLNLTKLVKTLSLAVGIVFDGKSINTGSITRGEAAVILREFAEI